MANHDLLPDFQDAYLFKSVTHGESTEINSERMVYSNDEREEWESKRRIRLNAAKAATGLIFYGSRPEVFTFPTEEQFVPIRIRLQSCTSPRSYFRRKVQLDHLAQ